MDIDKVFRSMTNIKPNENQIERIEKVRSYYKDAVMQLGCCCNDSRELSLAVTKLEESLMWAIKSIVLE